MISSISTEDTDIVTQSSKTKTVSQSLFASDEDDLLPQQTQVALPRSYTFPRAEKLSVNRQHYSSAPADMSLWSFGLPDQNNRISSGRQQPPKSVSPDRIDSLFSSLPRKLGNQHHVSYQQDLGSMSLGGVPVEDEVYGNPHQAIGHILPTAPLGSQQRSMSGGNDFYSQDTLHRSMSLGRASTQPQETHQHTSLDAVHYPQEVVGSQGRSMSLGGASASPEDILGNQLQEMSLGASPRHHQSYGGYYQQQKYNPPAQQYRHTQGYQMHPAGQYHQRDQYQDRQHNNQYYEQHQQGQFSDNRQTSNNQMHVMNSHGDGFKGYSATPPSGYTCKLCHVPGHWLRNCSLYLERKRGNQLHQQLMAELNGNPACAMISDEIRQNYTQLAQELYLGGSVNHEKPYPASVPRGPGQPMRHFPPDGYICRKCNTAGHWIQQCTMTRLAAPPISYVCRICNISGHWIYNCTHRVQIPSGFPPHYQQSPPMAQKPVFGGFEDSYGYAQ